MSETSTARRLQTLSPRGLDHQALPMRLWHKAKRHGIWNPQDLDFSQDIRDWQGLTDLEQDVLLRLSTLFQAGEEAVTVDLLPLIQVIAAEGRLEEEMYLTSFLWEEAKHVETFRRFFDEVAGVDFDLSHYLTDSYRQIFEFELPGALQALRIDPSPEAQARASVTYNMIVEGVLAETGYHAYATMLKRNGLMPGMQQAVDYLKADESRHLAFGVYLLSRLVAEHGDPLWEIIEARMDELLTPAVGIVTEIFAVYEELPFGLQLDEFVTFAMTQFGHRRARIEKARGQTLEEILRMGSV